MINHLKNKKEFKPKWIKKEDKGYTHASREGFYNTIRWKRVRNYIINNEPLCRECLSNGKVKPASLVDHKIPITEENILEFGEEWLCYDEENLAPLCYSCHLTKTRKDNSKYSEKNLKRGKDMMNDLDDWD